MTDSYPQTTNKKRVLGRGFQTKPVLDEATLRELGEKQVEIFYQRVEKTVTIMHPERSKGTERNAG